MKDIDTENLKALLVENKLKQKDLGEILNLTSPKTSALMSGVRKISDSEQKLLKLYFYGIMPFDMLAPLKGYGDKLEFTKEEWRVIDVMAKRNGYSDSIKWITANIRDYLAYCEAKINSPQHITPMVAETETEYGKEAPILITKGNPDLLTKEDKEFIENTKEGESQA